MIEELQKTYIEKGEAIRARLAEFEAIMLEGDDERLFEELVFCIFTAGASARMGLNSIEKVRPYLFKAGQKRLCRSLVGAHRYPNARAGYVVHTRNFLKRDYGSESVSIRSAMTWRRAATSSRRILASKASATRRPAII
jgi:thermostable 8-oxoguanine DNA glycosylase